MSLPRPALALVLLLALLGCQGNLPGGPGAEGSGTAESPEGTNPVPAGAASAPTEQDWPPPYMLHFGGWGLESEGLSIQVDEEGGAVFWTTQGGRVWRAGFVPEHGPELLSVCVGCDPLFTLDEDYLYFTRRTKFVRMSPVDGTQTVYDAPISDEGGGAVIDDAYVFSTAGECAAIARYEKPGLTSEVMLTDILPALDAGRVYLLPHTPAGIVCGNGTGIFAIDQWGGSATTLVEGVRSLWSLAATDERLYWVERDTPEPATVGVLDWEGTGGPQRFTSPVGGGDLKGACILPGTEKLLIPQMRTVEVFDGATSTFGTAIGLGGRPQYFACGQSALYAVVAGTRERDPGYVATEDFVGWIARVPYEDFGE